MGLRRFLSDQHHHTPERPVLTSQERQGNSVRPRGSGARGSTLNHHSQEPRPQVTKVTSCMLCTNSAESFKNDSMFENLASPFIYVIRLNHKSDKRHITCYCQGYSKCAQEQPSFQKASGVANHEGKGQCVGKNRSFTS